MFLGALQCFEEPCRVLGVFAEFLGGFAGIWGFAEVWERWLIRAEQG